MTIKLDDSVGRIVIDQPGAAAVFEELGIDYCCGGSRSLAETCAAKGLPIEEVTRRLETAAGRSGGESKDWQQATLSDLIEHIVSTHHVFTRSELNRLEPLLAKVRQVHGENHPELVRIERLFTGLKQELVTHMFKEEEVLFPFIVSMEQAAAEARPAPQPFFGTVRNPIRMMMFEHDSAGEALEAIRSLSSNYTVPADACTTFTVVYRDLQNLERDLHQHIHLENNLLFPRAVSLENDHSRSLAAAENPQYV